MKLIFAGTPEFAATTLAALIEEHDVVAVFTQPDRASGRGKKMTPPAVKILAEKHAISVYQPLRLGAQEAALIQQMNADVMVVVAYGMLLPQTILDLPGHGCLNIHASLLPRWRGAAPIQRAIETGDSKTGVCIMKMEAGLDTGPVYKTLETNIEQQDNATELYQRLAQMGADGVLATLEEIDQLTPIEQHHSAATYAKKLHKGEATIGWSQSAQQIQQRIRAFVEWPICQTSHNGNRIRIRQASVIKQIQEESAGKPGQIIALDKQGVYVACGYGQLRLENLQRDGGKALPYHEFRNGYGFSVGDLLI